MSDAEGAMPAPAGIVADLANPQDVLRTINFVTQGLTLGILTIFVALRLYARFKIFRGSLGGDDYAAFTAWFFMVGYCIAGIFLSVYGGGYHKWEVPVSQVPKFFKACYAATIFYPPMAFFVKLTLLLLIARVFEPYKKTIIGIYCLMGFLIAFYIASWVVKIRICNPIPAYWEGELSKCLDQGAIITSDSIISVISDLTILLIPLPLTWSLQMPFKKKLRVMGLLCAGGLATAFSIYRLGLVIKEGDSPDQTIVFVQIVLSGNAEVGIGLICACMPTINGLVQRRNTQQNSSSQPPGYVKSSGASRFKLSNLSTTKTDTQPNDIEFRSDQAGLVTFAQGDPEMDPAMSSGIIRTVDVQRSVTYKDNYQASENSNKSALG